MADKKTPVVVEGVGGTYELYTPMGRRHKTTKKAPANKTTATKKAPAKKAGKCK